MQQDIRKIEDILKNHFQYAKVIEYGDNYSSITIEVSDEKLKGMKKPKLFAKTHALPSRKSIPFGCALTIKKSLTWWFTMKAWSCFTRLMTH